MTLRALALLAAGWLLAPAAARAAYSFDLNFATNPVLPSAAGVGLNYVGSVAEATAFSVSGGVLRLDTITPAGDNGAYYQHDGDYSRTSDTLYEARLRTTAAGGIGVLLNFYEPNASVQLRVRQSGWTLFNGQAGQAGTGTFADPTAFHTFTILTDGTTETFTLAIDGVQVVGPTLLAPGFGSPAAVYFGDGTGTGGDERAEFEFVRYDSAFVPTAVPAPGGLALLAAGGPVLAWARRRRGG